MRAVVMPAAEIEFLDNWDVVGLQGTASVDFRAEGSGCPPSTAWPRTASSPWPAGPMWRIPLMSLIFPVLAAVPLGLARRAVSELSELAVTKTPFRSGRLLAEREVLQADLARATALIESGHHYLLVSLQALWQAGAAGSAPTVQQRAHARLAAVHATAGAAEAVLLCYRSAGSTALYRSNPLQRVLRDVNAATQHYGISAAGYELAGRALLGMEPDPGLVTRCPAGPSGRSVRSRGRRCRGQGESRYAIPATGETRRFSGFRVVTLRNIGAAVKATSDAAVATGQRRLANRSDTGGRAGARPASMNHSAPKTRR